MEIASLSAFSGEERRLFHCLAMQKEIGGAGLNRLLSALVLPSEVYRASERDLNAVCPGLSVAAVKSILQGPDQNAWLGLSDRCTQLGLRILVLGDGDYPKSIASLNAPPPMLFAEGDGRFPDETEAVALVGTRQPTEYGRRAAFTLARDLAQAGMTVISGMALGIDAAAHAGALDGGGRTIAVVGCGLDIEYPSGNSALRKRIRESGVVLSEFAPGTPPRRGHFPRRNRWLSAMARAVIVVEAGERSGALITAAFARAQNKALFAVPGSIFSPVSIGTHELLRQGARPAFSAQAVLRSLNEKSIAPIPREDSRGKPKKKIPSAEKSPPSESHPVLMLWRGEEICALEALEDRARRQAPLSGVEGAEGLGSLLHSLLQLEMQGLIERLPGSLYRKKTLV